jgi:hypothetical protein
MSLFEKRHPGPGPAGAVSQSHTGGAASGNSQKMSDEQKVVVIQRPPTGAAAPVLVDVATPRRTTRYGSKYEKAKLLGAWANKVSLLGVDTAIDLSTVPEKERGKYSDPLAIAEKALQDKTMPLGVRRFLPDGSHEDWFLDQLIFDF